MIYINKQPPHKYHYSSVFEKTGITITYAAFGSLTRRIPEFGYNFDVIVCDEIHSGIEMSNYGDDKQKHNYAKIAIERIKEIIDRSRVKIIALTATPTRAEKFFDGMVKYIPIHEDIRRYGEFKTIPYTNDKEIKSLNTAYKGIIYTPRITGKNGMIDIWDKLTQRGIKAVAVWSTRSKDHPYRGIGKHSGIGKGND